MNAPESRRLDHAGLVIAALLLVIAGLVLWDMSTLRITSTYGVGPKAMPIVVATGLIALALGNIVMTFQGGLPAREPYEARAVLLILGGLVALIAVIALGGGFKIGRAHV